MRRPPPGCFRSLRQCQAKCCGHGKICESVVIRECTWYKCISVDCGPLPDPTNGKVATPTGTSLEKLAIYACDDGYVLNKKGIRICLSSGQWSDTAPTCEPIECGPLDSPCGGSVSVLGTTVGSVATYSCDSGLSLVGDETRTCHPYGYWSGSMPCCEKKCSQLPGYNYVFGSSVYSLITTKVTFDVAKAACNADGTNLVKIETEDEQNFLDEIIGDRTNFWIGLFQASEDNWIWISDNSPLTLQSYQNWYSSGGPGSSNCVVIDYGEWWDVECSDGYNKYICECDSLM